MLLADVDGPSSELSYQRPLCGSDFFVSLSFPSLRFRYFNTTSTFQVEPSWTSSKATVLTPLAYVPGATIDRYLGNLNFFLIRETSSLREIGGLSR